MGMQRTWNYENSFSKIPRQSVRTNTFRLFKRQGNDSSILLRVILAFRKFWFVTVEENMYLILLANILAGKKEEKQNI